MTTDLATRLRTLEPLVGYWIMTDNPVAVEHIAQVGFDYIAVDLQHGFLDYAACVRAITAIDVHQGSVPLVRVPSNDPSWIGRVLDAGAQGVLVPLVNSAAEAEAAVRACHYPPDGVRSHGPGRSGGADRGARAGRPACIVMVETREAVEAMDAICATPGVDGIYIGPTDLAISLRAGRSTLDNGAAEFDDLLAKVLATATAAGLACGIHCGGGESAAIRLRQGFTFTTAGDDLSHLTRAATDEFALARR